MPPTKIETGTGSIREGTHRSKPQEITYQPAFVESPFILASLWRLIQERRREPKITVPREYYRGEATLPVSDMPPLVRDLRDQIRSLFEKPEPPAIPITSQPTEVEDLWKDYKHQPMSWLNSVIFHVIVIAALLLPYIVWGWRHPEQKQAEVVPITLSPYALHLPRKKPEEVVEAASVRPRRLQRALFRNFPGSNWHRLPSRLIFPSRNCRLNRLCWDRQT